MNTFPPGLWVKLLSFMLFVSEVTTAGTQFALISLRQLSRDLSCSLKTFTFCVRFVVFNECSCRVLLTYSSIAVMFRVFRDSAICFSKLLSFISTAVTSSDLASFYIWHLHSSHIFWFTLVDSDADDFRLDVDFWSDFFLVFIFFNVYFVYTLLV